MNGKTKTALKILQAAVLLGVLGDLLFRNASLGLNFFVWIALLVAAMIAILFRRDPERLNSQTLMLHAAVIFFAFTLIIRDAEALMVLTIFAILTILAVQTVSALNLKPKISGTTHYAAAAVWTGLSVILGPFILLTADIKWSIFKKTGTSKHLMSIAKGIAIALPILFVFGGLFAAADAVFEGLVQNVFKINPNLMIHVSIIGFISWTVAGYLRASMIGVGLVSKNSAEKSELSILSVDEREEARDEETTATEPRSAKKKLELQNVDNSILPEMFTLGAVEVGVILGLINLLFLIFVVIQIPYLFGGMQLIQNTPDFNLAEYARRGFGELIAVSALVLPILLSSHWLLRREDPVTHKLFKVLASIQIGLLFVIMISAVQRLLLLSGNLGYGLTAGRLYPIAFIILLAMIFVWFGITVLRDARENFAWGALWCGLFVLATLHILNPDDFIVRTNARLMQQGRPFDAEYNAKLSSDAVPALLESVSLMTPQNRERVLEKLYRTNCYLAKTEDIRSWNWSRRRAQSQVKNVPEISNKICEDDAEHFHY